MSSLTYIQKQQMSILFGIKCGYVFSYLKKGYNKTNTRDIILEAAGIDIYKNPDYDMSQEKCIWKICDECDNYTVGKLLKIMLDYFDTVTDWCLDHSEKIAYKALRELQEQYLSIGKIEIPSLEKDTLQLIYSDIEKGIANNTPELVLDRLHTFATEYLRGVCNQHNISFADNQGKMYPLHSLVGSLKKWYKDNDYFDSEFCVYAIQNSITIFEKYNDIRNSQSAAHPNNILNKIEAEFAVKIIADTLMFIDKIEKIKKEETTDGFMPQDERMYNFIFDGTEIPF